MSNSLCRNSVTRVYQEVIEDVIGSVRDVFKEEGVDEVILQELKQTWEAKVLASKALPNEQEEKLKQKQNEASTVNGFPKQLVAQSMHHPTMVNPHQVAQVVETKMVPIQITLPPQPGSDSQRILTIQVPASALSGNQLQKVLTGPVITATMGLPANIASTLLQQHVNAALGSQQQQTVTIVKQNIMQTDGQFDNQSGAKSDDDCNCLEIEFILPKQRQLKCSKSNKKTKKTSKKQPDQLDGPLDTSDEDEEASDDNDDEDEDFDEEKDEDHDIEDEGGEEEPLNSEDDVSEDDPEDLFDTDNIVVCQYDKIIRNRNKWKFYLKDGIMNLAGKDYVFQKANGDAEW